MARKTSDLTKWKRFQEKLKSSEHAHVKVGVLAKSGRTADGTMSMVELAAIHEFGSPKAGIPERSFIRRTFENNKGDVARVTRSLAIEFVNGRVSLHRALSKLGAWGATQVKDTIAKGPHIPPPLKPATVARKGSDRPLVDTGRLVGSIQWEVEGAGSEGRAGWRK